jgi:hypothetical protein
MENLSGSLVDSLVALVEDGPLWDGNVPSKQGRDECIERGWAVRVVVKGNDGYTAATYAGRNAYNKHFGGDTVRESHANRLRRRVVNV